MKMHVDILKSDSKSIQWMPSERVCEGCAVKYAWIDAQRRDYLPDMCAVLAVGLDRPCLAPGESPTG